MATPPTTTTNPPIPRVFSCGASPDPAENTVYRSRFRLLDGVFSPRPIIFGGEDVGGGESGDLCWGSIVPFAGPLWPYLNNGAASSFCVSALSFCAAAPCILPLRCGRCGAAARPCGDRRSPHPHTRPYGEESSGGAVRLRCRYHSVRL